MSQRIPRASNQSANTSDGTHAEPSASDSGREALRGMSFAEGAAALAPDGGAAAADKGPVKGSVIQKDTPEYDAKQYSWHTKVLIGVGKNRGLQPGMLVVAGMYKGAVQSVFPNRARVTFFGGYDDSAATVTVKPGERWSYQQWLAQKGKQEQAGSTDHGKSERGGQ